MTVPAYFNDAQRQATKDAAAISGLNVLRCARVQRKCDDGQRSEGVPWDGLRRSRSTRSRSLVC